MRRVGLIFLFAVAPSVSAPTVKRLLVLPPVAEASADSAYIGPSLAEAIRTKLAEKYFFFHPDEEAVEATRRNNFIQDEDLHTKSAAVQMGEWLRQDLVMNGRYSLAGNRLKLNLNVYEIETGKLLLNFRTETAVSAKMFDTFHAIASQLGEKMAEALPSQQELASSGGSYYDPEKGKRTLIVAGGMRALGFAKSTGNLSGSSTLSNADFPQISVALTYQRHNLLDLFSRRLKIPVFAQFALISGYARREYSRDGSSVPVRLVSVEALPSLGYAFGWKSFRFEPYVGAGLGYANFYFDYGLLARKPVDTTLGQAVSTQTVEQFAIISQLGMTLKFALHPRWAVTLTPAATFYHYAGGTQGDVAVRMGAGVYF